MTKATEVVVYEQNESTLVEAAAKSRGLKIQGIDDTKGYALVHTARMELKGYRVEIDKTRKQLNADALEWQRKVNSEAKRLTALIEPTERELEAEEERIDAEKAALETKLLDERMAALTAFGSTLPPSVVQGMGDNEFTAVLEDAAQAHESRHYAIRIAQEEKARLDAEAAAARLAEEKRLAAEREQRAREESERAAEAARLQQIERERLAAERAELDRQQATQKVESDRIARERGVLEAEQAQAAKDRAAEAARKEAEERAAAQAAARAAQEAEEAARVEARRPEIERVQAFAKSIEALIVPDVWCKGALRGVLTVACQRILTIAEESK